MFILNSLSHTWTNVLRTFRSPNGNETPARESTELLGNNGDPPSLSGGFEGFERSSTAIKLCIFHVICYYLAAVLCFSFLFEKWTVINSIYFATVLFLTIGYGDLSPSTFLGRSSVIILALYGIILLGIFLGIIGENIMEYQAKLWDRQQEEVRRQILNTVEKAATERSDTGASQPLDMNRNVRVAEDSLLQEIKEAITLESPVLLAVLVFGVIIGHFEGWTMFESIYFTVITGTTIGFGDYYPHTPLVRLAFCFFLPLLVAVLGKFLATVASAYMKTQRRRLELKFLNRIMTVYDLQAMDENNDGEVQKSEFLAFMLVALKKVEKEEVSEIMSLFDKLDVTKNGTISRKDIIVSRSMIFKNVMGDSDGSHDTVETMDMGDCNHEP